MIVGTEFDGISWHCDLICGLCKHCIQKLLLEWADCWTNCFATMFWLHRIARSSTAVFADLLLVCSLADATCAVANVMTALIFIILIVSQLHAFFLVVPVRSSLHALVAVAIISCFQHTGHVAFEGRGNSLSNKPVFPWPPISLTTNSTAKNLKLVQVEHAFSQIGLICNPSLFWQVRIHQRQLFQSNESIMLGH